MSDFFLRLFMIFCSSEVFSWLLVEFIPWVIVYSVCTLLGGVFHGKPV